jgi:hypothetical protein
MYNKNMFNKKIVAILLLILVVLGALFFLFFPSKNSGLEDYPTPTPVGGIGKPDGSSGAAGPSSQSEIEDSRKSSAVYALIPDMPHVGKNFSLYYSYKGDLFILYINPSQKEAGNTEFDAFLKKSGVDDRSWFKNIFTTYITPTPTAANTSPTLTPAP